MALDVSLFKDFIELNKEKKELESQLDKIKKQMTGMQDFLTDSLLENSMTKITVGDRTVYVAEQLWASVSNKERAIEILEETGYGDYIKPTYNVQQLSRLLRDLKEQEELPPKEFEGIIDPLIKTNLKVVKA
jgi:hypothetical protein